MEWNPLLKCVIYLSVAPQEMRELWRGNPPNSSSIQLHINVKFAHFVVSLSLATAEYTSSHIWTFLTSRRLYRNDFVYIEVEGGERD